MIDRDRYPAKPAAAYHEVALILGEEYFAKPPPRAGRRVEVTSYVDGYTTTWEVTFAQNELLMATCAGRKDLWATSGDFNRDLEEKPEVP